MDTFEFIEHTADIGIRVKAKTLEELFSFSAKSLFFIVIGDVSSKCHVTREIELEAGTIEDLLVVWLNELLSLFYTYGFFPSNPVIYIKQNPVKSLRAKIKGFRLNPYSMRLKQEVKAATYHNLKITKNSKGYVGEIIFDV
jgi:SHS2 domain-containing protein